MNDVEAPAESVIPPQTFVDQFADQNVWSGARRDDTKEPVEEEEELYEQNPNPPLVAIDVPSIAQMMGDEIQQALGEEPTPESCEAAGAMLTAARDYLLAQRRARFGRRSSDSTHENLKRLVQVFGSGTEDNDPAP